MLSSVTFQYSNNIIIIVEFATIPFYLVLCSTVIVELANSTPFIFKIAFQPLLLSTSSFHSTMLCRFEFAKPEDLITRSNFLSFCSLTMIRIDHSQKFIIFSNGCSDFLANRLNCYMNLQQHSVASNLKVCVLSSNSLSRSMTHRLIEIWKCQWSGSVSPLI